MKIAMWSGPRNLSTALMRSFANRSDVSLVLDEPMYGYYLQLTGKNHPMTDDIKKSLPTSMDGVIELCTNYEDNNLSYQKHMIHHLMGNFSLDWLDTLTNCFLIRNPQEVVPSFLQKLPHGRFNDMAFGDQLKFFNYLKDKNKKIPIVIDANDIRMNPEKCLKILCNKLNISWDENMLRWEKGIMPYDGIWAEHWYPSVIQSNSFRPPSKQLPSLTDIERRLVDKAMPFYQKIYQYKI